MIEARQHGAALNGVTVQFVDSGLVSQGNETVVYDDSNPSNKTLTFDIESGRTTANDLVGALQNNGSVNAIFTIELEGKDPGPFEGPGSGVVDLTATAASSGGSGIDFDRTNGIQIVNLGQTFTVDFQSAETIDDLLNRVNSSGAGVLASINAQGTGIDLRSVIGGADFQLGENGGTTAAELGIRSHTRDTALSDLNFGRGVFAANGTDFTVHRKDGTDLAIDVSAASTVGDVIDLINNHTDNVASANPVLARLASFGNGIKIVDSNVGGPDTLTITREPLSQAAHDLGLIAGGEDQTLAPSGSPEAIVGADTHFLETQGVFNTLIRLRGALDAGDVSEIERTVALLDDDLDRANLARAELGTRDRSLDVLERRLRDENVELRTAISDEIDVDLVEAISDLVSRQAAFEASLRLIAQTLQLSLLDFL